MTVDSSTAAINAAVAGVIAGALGFDTNHVFAAGIAPGQDGHPLVVPLADDFTEAGMPAITVAMARAEFLPQPSNQRQHRDIYCLVWRPRLPLEETLRAFSADFEAINDAFFAHARLNNLVPEVESAILAELNQPADRSVAGADFLTLPFTVRVTVNHYVNYQPS